MTPIRAVTKGPELGIFPGYYEQVIPADPFIGNKWKIKPIGLFSCSIPTY